MKGKNRFAGNIWQLLSPSINTPSSLFFLTHTLPHFTGSYLLANRWETVLLTHVGCSVFLTSWKKILLGFRNYSTIRKDPMKSAVENRVQWWIRCRGHYCVRGCVCVSDANLVRSQINWLDLSSCKRRKYPGLCLKHDELAGLAFSNLI